MIELSNVNAVKAKMEELKQDPAFVKKASKLESLEDIAALMREKGIDVTAEQLKESEEYLQENQSMELNEEQLEQASGGFAISSLIIGGAIILGGAFFAKGLWDGYWRR